MKNNIIQSLGLILILGIFFGCKKYDNPPPVFEEIQDLTSKQRKVLVITIDGVSGADLKELAPQNIVEMQKTAKYTYNTLGTETNAAGWVSMLTGTGIAKHEVRNDDFERTHDENNEDHDDDDSMPNFRNVLDYVTQYKAVSTALVSPWESLRNYVKNADYLPIVNSDIAVKDSAAFILQNTNSLGAAFVNFRDAKLQGDQAGYTLTNAGYKQAIVKADEYIANLIQAVKARKNYEKEDWLIVVTTSHGGSETNSANGFCLFYNPLFKPFELRKTGFNTIFFNDKNTIAVLKDEAKLYDAGQTKSFTVQMDVKFMNKPNSYSSFFSKSTNLSGQNITGWQWNYYPEGKWVVTLGGSANGGSGKLELASLTEPGTSIWRTLTMTVDYVNTTTRTLTTYMDGVKQGSRNISDRKSISSIEDFKIGHRRGDADVLTTFYAGNLTYFNTAISEETVKNTFKLTDITKHPNYANVVGYWPMDEGAEGVFFNKYTAGSNFNLTGKYLWAYLGDSFPYGTVANPVTSNLSIVNTSSDIAAATLYWLKIPILADFNYDGKPVLNNFEIDFLKD